MTWGWAEHADARRCVQQALAEHPGEAREWSARLDELGVWLAGRKGSWSLETHAAHEARDAAAAELWAAWLTGSPWSAKEGWDATWLPEARKVFGGVTVAHGLPAGARRNAVDDLSEAFFYRLLGTGVGAPGWAELAVRTLETVSPIGAVVDVLDPVRRRTAAVCATRRGHWRRTVARRVPLRLHADRAREAAAILAEPGAAEAHVDLHIALRLIDSWAAGSVDRDHAIVLQNRGRARGRLRALAASGGTDALAEPLLDLPALHARTRAGVRRYAWAWATQELGWGFTFSADRPVTPPCNLDEAAVFAPEAGPAARTWVLLVILRGRWEHLAAWVRSGSTGDRDSTWGRLLGQLPEALVGEGTGPARLATTRSYLCAVLDELFDELEPAVLAVAALSPGRALRRSVEAAIGPLWDASIPMPSSGFPTMRAHAQAFADWHRSGTDGPIPSQDSDDF